jgi:3'-phosphoadenosine 5'-phosphosulfate sulfotransferase (PAPS reductase)/FAD synthetase
MNPVDLKRKYIIRTNYGDDSIALTQWAYEAGFKNLRVVYTDTGFAAARFQERIHKGKEHIQRLGFEAVTITSKIRFDEAVLGRRAFPSHEIQWCTSFLKGLPFLEWLDSVDLNCEAVIMMAKRQSTVPNQVIPECIEHCEFHNERAVWHPLIEINDDERNALLERAGVTPLNHRSLECEPCVNSNVADLARMQPEEIDKLEALESELNTSLFSAEDFGAKGIRLQVKWAKENTTPQGKKGYHSLFYRGCGNHFGCGL